MQGNNNASKTEICVTMEADTEVQKEKIYTPEYSLKRNKVLNH